MTSKFILHCCHHGNQNPIDITPTISVFSLAPAFTYCGAVMVRIRAQYGYWNPSRGNYPVLAPAVRVSGI